MKLRIEISPEESEEIVIRCNERTDDIKRIEKVIENLINADAECILYIGEMEYFVPYKKILFFEASEAKFTPTQKIKCLLHALPFHGLRRHCQAILLEALSPAL